MELNLTFLYNCGGFVLLSFFVTSKSNAKLLVAANVKRFPLEKDLDIRTIEAAYLE